jgi:hypothetical protein
MVNNFIMELTCERRPSKRDGILRLHWKTGFRVPIKQQGNNLIVGGLDSIKESHRTITRLAPALSMFNDWIQSEPVIEGIIASIFFIPEDMDDGRGLSRILQALKDSYRERYPGIQMRKD